MSELPVKIGDAASFAKTVSESDIYAFAGVTGDFAAPHTNEEYMKRTQYGERVAHGALLVGFMSTASAILGGRLTEGREDLTPMSLGYDRVRFVAPVRIGDTITVTYEVSELEPERRRSRSTLTATNQHGETVGVAEHIMKWLENP
ncbi:MAG: MaoC family dehydratase [Alphaproteobacteria bacterium]|jgi:acyl dehydratase|nr:MaoC family dehydratase [Alphaproteobacteria bacterium]MDP6568006.1 MaoC family dehydratase [Alphaproteobacteria bacterium]MDP6814385.1 MaoC family dehydratase [Alphaproteobacteria bacterium]